MKLLIILFSTILISLNCSAHSGGTDSSGGHNCSQKSKEKGLCTGYHYHNGKLVPIEKPQLRATATSEGLTNTSSKLLPITPLQSADSIENRVIVDKT